MEIYLNAFVAAVSLTALLAIVFWPMRTLRVDEYRQKIFDIRNELFLYAARGHISFDHPAYGRLRTMFNGSIRFSHRLSLLHMLLLAIWLIRSRVQIVTEWEEEWERAVADLPADTLSELECFRDRLKAATAGFLFFGSFTKFLLFYPVYLVCKFLIESVVEPIHVTDGHTLGEEVSWSERTSIDSLQIAHIRKSVDSLEAGAYIVGSAVRHASA